MSSGKPGVVRETFMAAGLRVALLDNGRGAALCGSEAAALDAPTRPAERRASPSSYGYGLSKAWNPWKGRWRCAPAKALAQLLGVERAVVNDHGNSPVVITRIPHPGEFS